MKLLVFDAGHCLSLALDREVERRLDLELSLVDESCDALEALDSGQFDALVLPPLAHLDAISPEQVEAHASRVEAMIAGCRGSGTILVWCISDQIYEHGYDEGAIEEGLIPRPESAPRKRLVAVGDRVRAELPRHLVVRVGPLFGSEGEEAWLPDLLETLEAGRRVHAEQDLFVGPTPVEGLARALCGMLLQLDNGAEAWGAYHLAGIEPVSLYTFVAAVRTQLEQQLSARGLPVDGLGEVEAVFREGGMVRRVLNCRRMLGTFGVHQKPWRLELERLIEQWLDERFGEPEAPASMRGQQG